MKLKILENDEELKDNWNNKIIVISKSQLNNVFDSKQNKEIIDNLRYITSNKIETYEDKYLATFNFIFSEQAENGSKVEKIGLYSDFKNFSIYVTNNKNLLSTRIENLLAAGLDHAGIFINLIEQLTENDYIKLENLENDLNDFADRLIKEKDLESCTKKISSYRRLLIRYKHHYEQLNNIIDFFSTHLDLFSLKEDQKQFLVLSKRIPKLYNEILYLRDVLSQLRESYQSQVEIKQNNLMKTFTLITAIFMPLQLIVGWYGMNLIMPEFKYAVAYPIVIAVCVIFIVVAIVVFYKKKWFK